MVTTTLKQKCSSPLQEYKIISKTIVHNHHTRGRKVDPQKTVVITKEEHDKQHKIGANAANPKILTLYNGYHYWQTELGRAERILGSYRGTLRNTTPSPYISNGLLEKIEKSIEQYKVELKVAEKELMKGVRKTKEWQSFMKKCPGLKEITAGLLISRIKIRKADHCSSLWKFMGYIPNDKGKRLSNPGILAAYHAPLWAALAIAVVTRKKSLYRQDYDGFKAQGLSHKQSVYRVIKLWLAHLWETWRKWKKLPIDLPYAKGILRHSDYIKAEERGWPKV